MPKKFFIRRSHSELVQEQNKLLETILAKQDAKPEPKIIYRKDYVTSPEFAPTLDPESYLDFDFDDEAPYIPKNVETDDAKLTVATDKAAFDGDSVEKLKKARAKPRRI